MIRVLVAEDQAMVPGALSALLNLEPDIELLGAAADGESARRDLQPLKPDGLVTDIEMPGLTGLELAQRIQRHGLPIKVVIVTTFALRASCAAHSTPASAVTCSRTRRPNTSPMRSGRCNAAAA